MFGNRAGSFRARLERLEPRQMLSAASWGGKLTGSWEVAANWSDDAVPTSKTDVTIATSGATVTIPAGATASAASLTIAAGAALAMPAGPSQLVAGSIANGGTLTVGPANTVTISGTFTQTSTGTLDLQLGGAPSTGSFGLVNAAGAAALAGTLRSEIVNGYSPTTTDTFTPMGFASRSGSFAQETLPSGPGYRFNAAVTFTNVVLSAAPTTPLTATVNASTALHPVTTNLLGINSTYWDSEAVTVQTQEMATAAGLDIYRFPGGSASDDFHFNVADNWGDSAAITVPQFVQFIASVGGTGVVTLDYGSASPQEAAAELAYVDGSPTDTTAIGNGIEWNDSSGQWQTVNWGTGGYWAGLRAASPLAEDDGLNFMRSSHPAPFTGITSWEVGNEEYGSWEIDHHGTAGPGGAGTGSAHDPATYAAFAAQFASLAREIQTAAGLPQISIGIDSGDPTGASDDNWTSSVLTDGLADGFVPGFISDHSYMQAPGAESDSFLLDDSVSDSGSLLDWSTRYADYQSVLQHTLGSQASSVQVMATEYNSVYTNPGKQSTSLVNGLFVAESLGSLLESGYSGGFAWDLRNGWDPTQNDSNLLYGWREGGDYGQLGDPNDNAPPTTGPYVGYPGYYALQLASKVIQSGAEVVSATSNYNDLDVYAVMEPSGDLDLLVINANPAASLTEQFDLTGCQPLGPAQVWQYGETQDTAQSLSASGASALASASTSVGLSGSDFSYTFPAYSMTVLDLQAFTSIAISPASSSLDAGQSKQFSASALNQFGKAVASQPAFAWSLIGSGSLTAGGLYTPPYAAGTATIEASFGAMQQKADITFSGQAQWVSNVAASWTASGDWTSTISDTAIAAPGLRGISGDTIVFAAAAVGAVDLNGASPSLAAVTFTGASGSAITQGTGGSLLLNNGANPASITVSGGSDTIGAPIVLGGNLLIDPAAGGTLNLSGAISGESSKLIQGAGGTTILSGVNSYTGGTVIDAGTLVVDGSRSLPAGGALVIGGGTLIFDPSSTAQSQGATAAPSATLSATASAEAASSSSTPTRRASEEQKATFPTPTRRASGEQKATSPTPTRRASEGPQVPRLRLGLVLEESSPRIAGDLAWLGQAASSSDNSDLHHKKLPAIQALDALFAQYDG